MLTPPRPCIVCEQTLDSAPELCSGCERELPWQPPGCQRCGEPDPTRATEEFICGRCLKQPPAFDSCHAVLAYATPVAELINRFKFRGRLAEGRTLTRLLARHFIHHYHGRPAPECLVPVPMHPRRLCRRGFNQAVEIARQLSNMCQVPLNYRSCRKIHSGPAQRELGSGARRNNIRDAFRIRPANSLTGAGHIAIIDDVVTTGATADELARILRSQGVEQIDVWALARTNTE